MISFQSMSRTLLTDSLHGAISITAQCLSYLINHFHVEFLKWNNPPSTFGTVHYHFKGYQDENLKFVSQPFRAWSDYTDVYAGLTLYWWQRLITFGVCRIRVKSIFCVGK